MDNEAIFNMITLLDRKFTTFAQQAGYEFDLEGNATRVGKPSQVVAVTEKEKPKRDPVKMRDYDLSTWPEFSDEELFNDWRRAKKSAGGSVSQRAISTIGKQLMEAVNNGFNVSDCLATAESAKWQGFQAYYMKKPDTKVVRRSFMALARGEHLDSMPQPIQPQIEQSTNPIDQFAIEYERHKRVN